MCTCSDWRGKLAVILRTGAAAPPVIIEPVLTDAVPRRPVLGSGDVRTAGGRVAGRSAKRHCNSAVARIRCHSQRARGRAGFVEVQNREAKRAPLRSCRVVGAVHEESMFTAAKGRKVSARCNGSAQRNCGSYRSSCSNLTSGTIGRADRINIVFRRADAGARCSGNRRRKCNRTACWNSGNKRLAVGWIRCERDCTGCGTRSCRTRPSVHERHHAAHARQIAVVQRQVGIVNGELAGAWNGDQRITRLARSQGFGRHADSARRQQLAIFGDEALSQAQRTHGMVLRSGVYIAQQDLVSCCADDLSGVGINLAVDQKILGRERAHVKERRTRAAVQSRIDLAQYQHRFFINDGVGIVGCCLRGLAHREGGTSRDRSNARPRGYAGAAHRGSDICRQHGGVGNCGRGAGCNCRRIGARNYDARAISSGRVAHRKRQDTVGIRLNTENSRSRRYSGTAYAGIDIRCQHRRISNDVTEIGKGRCGVGPRNRDPSPAREGDRRTDNQRTVQTHRHLMFGVRDRRSLVQIGTRIGGCKGVALQSGTARGRGGSAGCVRHHGLALEEQPARFRQ